jgi:hypothetical protein
MLLHLDLLPNATRAVSEATAESGMTYLRSLLADAGAIELPHNLARLQESLTFIARPTGVFADSVTRDSAYLHFSRALQAA